MTLKNYSKAKDSKKLIFGNKVTTRSNITLIENKKVVTSEIELDF